MLNSAPQRESDRSPGGFTLMEILLVLGLLLVISAITWPALTALVGRRRVELAATDVQVMLGAARVRATEAGVTYQFRYEPGGRRYILVPADAAEFVAVADTPGTDVATAATAAWKREGTLPESVTFRQTQQTATAADGVPAELLSGLVQARELAQAAWGPAVLFHPDGTATDSQFTIVDDDDEALQITVRGLTGSSHSAFTVVEGN